MRKLEKELGVKAKAKCTPKEQQCIIEFPKESSKVVESKVKEMGYKVMGRADFKKDSVITVKKK